MQTRDTLTLGIALAATAVATFTGGVSAHILNDVLPHEYVATLSAKAEASGAHSDGLALFRATLDQRPHVHDATRPFKPGDPFAWRVSFTRLSSPVRAMTLRGARPGRTGRTLATLCAPCTPDAHGTLSLNGPLAIALDQAPFCLVRAPCSAAQPEQFTVYVEIATARHPHGEIRGQLRFCSTTPTFRNRGSCTPPGYPPLAGGH